MKSKKLTAIIISLLLIFTVSACSSDYNKTIEENWGISLPKGYKELFSTDSGVGFHGDGERYHVFGYKEKLKQSAIKEFSSQKNTNLEDEVGKILNLLKVSSKEKPDFTKEYYWYKKIDDNDSDNKLYLIYFIEDNVFYVIEDFY